MMWVTPCHLSTFSVQTVIAFSHVVCYASLFARVLPSRTSLKSVKVNLEAPSKISVGQWPI
jgi:hypothetical protein